MIKVGQIINDLAPVADTQTGEKRKIVTLCDQLFCERMHMSSWVISEGERRMESTLPSASGFHRDATLMKMIMNKYSLREAPQKKNGKMWEF